MELVRTKYPTKTKLCKKFGITWQTLKNWRNEDKDFDAAYKGAENEYLQRLEEPAINGLKRRVEGYEYDEIKTVYVPSPSGEPVIATRTVTTKHMPPDVQAIIFVLTNIDPQYFEK